MAINYKGIGHIGLRIRDMDKACEFYGDILELPMQFEVRDEEGIRIRFYKLSTGQYIELIRSESSYDGRNHKGRYSHWHCCLEVDARHEAYRDLDRKKISCSRKGDDSVAFDGSWAAFIEDPEGNEWELMEFSPISKQIVHLPNNMNPKE